MTLYLFHDDCVEWRVDYVKRRPTKKEGEGEIRLDHRLVLTTGQGEQLFIFVKCNLA